MQSYQENIILDDFVAEEPYSIIQFGRNACTPCSAVASKLDFWLEDHPEVKALYVDLDFHPKVGAQRGIFAVPTIQAFSRGQLIVEGSAYFSLEDFLAKLERYLELSAD